MIKGQKSIRGGIEDFLCPFTDMFITQGANGGYSHKGTMANDVRGITPGIKYAYYSPCTMKCLHIYSASGQSMWQSVNKVRFSNGNISFATVMIAHDDTQDCYVGQIVEQGNQLGNMGVKGYATGVHAHIEIEQGSDTSWNKNAYGNYCFNNEVDTDDCYFMDGTNILNCQSANWKYLKDVPVVEKQEIETGNYKCLSNMKVRSGAGINYKQVKVCDLTKDGKEHATSKSPNAYAVYKEGTIFTAKSIITAENGSIWGRSPSGFICIKDNERIYCEKC